MSHFFPNWPLSVLYLGKVTSTHFLVVGLFVSSNIKHLDSLFLFENLPDRHAGWSAFVKMAMTNIFGKLTVV